MWFRKTMRYSTNRLFTAISCALFLSGCSAGLLGGDLSSKFKGISEITVLGPESIEINWENEEVCSSYSIYNIANGSSEDNDALETVAAPPVRISTPNISPDTKYYFAVGCRTADKDQQGLSNIVEVTSWGRFNGLVNALLDTSSASPVIQLQWNYANTGVRYLIYAKLSNVPGDLSSWGLTPLGGSGSGYSESPICETFEKSIRVGPGGSCNPSILQPGQVYNFKIVAQYPDGRYSTDLVGNGTSVSLPSAFSPPNCVLTSSGLGPDINNSYLFLRCDTTTAGTTSNSCPFANLSTRAFQAINGTRTAISDTLSGSGTLTIQPLIPSNQPNNRVVEGLEIEYTCSNTNPSTKSIVRYDDSSLLRKKPSLKYITSYVDGAPNLSASQSPTQLGTASTVGDFNCDGKPDLAVGLPYITYSGSPYFNRVSQAGLVKVYYNYVTQANGSATFSDTQILGFRDLQTGARFGFSVSSGNINRDVAFDNTTQKYYSCDDLIVGSPGNGTVASVGAAYVFYGHPQKFAQPLDQIGLARNAATCTGTLTSQVCSPVKLTPDLSFFRIDPAHSLAGGDNSITDNMRFGTAVSFVRDFNADGYGDIAIGDPFCDWDGEITNGQGYKANDGTIFNKLTDVGCVYVYWGGRTGISTLEVGRFPGTSTPILSPLVKVYAPIPQQGSRFGEFISNAGDVDGALPVPIPMNGTNEIIMASGHDFIVSAPNFRYDGGTATNQPLLSSLGLTKVTNWPLTTSGSETIDPVVAQGPANFAQADTAASNKVTPPLNGAWAPGSAAWSDITGMPTPAPGSNLYNSTGIAFLFRGRSSHVGYKPTLDADFKRFPNQVASNFSTAGTSLHEALSSSVKSRRNGSRGINFSGISWIQSPNRSFYNCGTRGSPTGNQGGLYKHISCLAGRNNFSLIYPVLSSNDTPVSNFGAKAAIASPPEENAIALYELSDIPGSPFYDRVIADGVTEWFANNSGNIHPQVRGTALWEIGIKKFSVPGNLDSCETYTDPNSPDFIPGSCSSYKAEITRAPVREVYELNATEYAITPEMRQISDINRDGYSDILISGSASQHFLYTYFGNYAADFSYASQTTSAGACTVTRNITNSSDGIFTTANDAITANLPFSTFEGRSAARNNSGTLTDRITSTFPVYRKSPNDAEGYAYRFFGDSSTMDSLNYPTTVNRSTLGQSCGPQRKTYNSIISSISVADLNGDSLLDGVIGFSDDSNQQGRAVATYASSAGTGLIADTNFNTGSALGSRAGSQVTALNWTFLTGVNSNPEERRREIFVGATGHTNAGVPGAGAYFNYSASGTNTLTAASLRTLFENLNTPNDLQGEYSKVVGDVNGDGFDDVWTPVKRYSNPGGSEYFDAIIYFGSAFGPVTTSFCLERLSTIERTTGSMTAADCEASSGSTLAKIANIPIRLPQYLTRPLNLGTRWSFPAFGAGDVDNDGKDDVIVMDSQSGIYLFFGSDNGIINGQPTLGPSANKLPQTVTRDVTILGSSPAYRSYIASSSNSYFQNYSLNGNTGSPETAFAYNHGDFNGDGYEDLAIGLLLDSPSPENNWICSPGSQANPQRVDICGNGGSVAPTNPKGRIDNHGGVVVLYGSATGIQTPLDSSQVPIDFTFPANVSCADGYTNDACRNNNQFHFVYGSLSFDPGTKKLPVIQNTPCDTATGICKASLIRNPIFFNAAPGDLFFNTPTMFGSSITVADANGDGIDDLIVGFPRFYHPSFSVGNQNGFYKVVNETPARIFDEQNLDSFGKGSVMIYYGVKRAGLVAPSVQHYLSDYGLGLKSGLVPNENSTVFTLYPMKKGSGPQEQIPPLEASGGNHVETQREFGVNMTSADFNGDRFDDIAIASSAGQVYVYYGPICPLDNSAVAVRTNMYTRLNRSEPITGLAQGQCNVLNFNVDSISSLQQMGSPTLKSFYPQVIHIAGTSPTTVMGSTLVAQRHKRSVASTNIIKYRGNINGDSENTADLVLGSPLANDPNISSGSSLSGVGYVLFGHKTPIQPGEMNSNSGLYVETPPAYQSSILGVTSGGSTKFFYTPMILKPHTSNLSIAEFFFYETGIGDFNGDGRSDLIMNTSDINSTSNGTSVIQGGGFRSFY